MMRLYMDNSLPSEIVAALVIALRAKGESVDELVGCVRAMRHYMNAVDTTGIDCVELVGTGGDGQCLFNISSASCFVVAAAGATVAKHFNRSNSSKSGGADCLEALGANLSVPPKSIIQSLKELGLAFMFAPLFHPAMRHLAPVRKILATRTIFNLLGPLSNPAGVKRAVVGVFDTKWQQPIAQALAELGYECAWVVHSNGTDELMINAVNHITELRHGNIQQKKLDAKEFGLVEQPLSALQVADAKSSAALITRILQGDARAPGFSTVLLNAAAALYVAGMQSEIATAIEEARTILLTGKAHQLMQAYCAYSRTLIQEEYP